MNKINNTQKETDKTRQTKTLNPQYPVSPINVENLDVSKYLDTLMDQNLKNKTTTEFLTGLKNQNIKKSDFKNIIRNSSVRCIEVRIHNKYTIVELEFNEKYFHGLAVCNHSDRNRIRTGMAIAYRRAFVKLEEYIYNKCTIIELTGCEYCECRAIDPAKNSLEELVIIQVPSENEILDLSRQVMRSLGLL